MTSTDERALRIEQAVRLRRAAARAKQPELPPRPPEQPARLGEMQRGLWLLHRLRPGSAAYNLASAFRVRGELEVRRLEAALSAVVARHRLLRSTFRQRRDGVRQIVAEPTRLAVEVVEAEKSEAVAAAVAAARQPFDLEQGPLVRMRLVREEGGREPLLLLALHHILADERSLGFLWRDLAAAYAGRLPESPPAIQYDDYVHWAGRRPAEEARRDLDFWRPRLEPPPEELDLPFETPAGRGQAARGRLLWRSLGGELGAGVRRLAAAAGCTPFAVFAFAFRLLLDRYTGGRPVAFATPASTRSHPATAEMIGYFLNPVVVSVEVDERRPVAEAVRRFGEEVRRLLAHASVPFEVLFEELAPPRQPDRHPLFQAMFVHQQAAPPPALGDTRLEPVTLDLGESKFDLTLFVTEAEGSLEIAVEYRADRFEEVWMRRLLDHYETLIAHLPADLRRATADVPTMAEAEERELAAAATGAELRRSAADLLPRRILAAAGGAPERPAVICGGEGVSYGELTGSADAIARELARRDVGAGGRVGLFVERSALMIAAILGCHRAGAAYVPLDPGYPQARNRDVLEDAEVAAVLTTSGGRGGLPAGPWPAIEIDRLEAGEAAGEPPEPSADAVAYLLYTSGSTGRPKGVVVTHGNLAASNGARLQHYARPPGRFLLVPSVAFDSSVAGIFWTLSTAGTLVIPTEEEVRDARLLARLVEEAGVTSLLCVPSLYDQLLAVGAERLRGLEVAIVAGESCPARLVAEHRRRLPGVRLFNEYGPTEATVWATVRELGDADAAGPVSIGRPIPGVRLRLLDALGRPVPAGIPAEAWIEGPTVAAGYWRRRQLTGDRFAADPVTAARRYRTGDRMAWTADRRLLFLGRGDEQIKLRGFRIEPGEIEAALLGLEGVEQAAAVARPTGPAAAASAGPAAAGLVAFVVGRPAASWRRHLGRRLPEAMIPSRLVELPELPRLPNGKIDRRRLADLPLEPAPAAASGPPPSAREQSLIELWRGLLGVEAVGVDDNFFELGGHSLLVVEMALAVERDLGVTVSAAEVFENPTVRELARRIEGRAGRATPAYRHLYPIQPAGRGAPFVVALPHFFTDLLAARFRGERPVYGLRGVGLRPEGNLGRWRTMRQLGEELVEEIGRRFPGEPCILAGYSFGASMAFEAARLMEDRGLPVRRLYLIAPMALDLWRLGPLRLELAGLRRPLAELSTTEALGLWARGNHPLTRRPYRRAWWRLAVEPWRRLLQLVGRLRLAAGLPLTSRILHADVRVDRFRLHARFRPGVVRTATVFFNPREPETDCAATWRPHFAGPFSVVPMPDPHLDEESVAAARKVILGVLEEIGDEAC